MSAPTDAPDAETLDAYSQVVSGVAAALLPSIASVEAGRRRTSGSGSAVVFTPDGYLLTSAHVVSRSRHGRIALLDGRAFDYELAGADPLSDLAVLRTEATDLVPAPLGDAAALRAGQLVVALGSPLGFSGSVSAGVVSALGRSFPTSNGRVSRVVENVIQTDAALHPGNSGGALATGRGEVIGINTAVVGPHIGQGLGLAVPINATSRHVIASLMHKGKVRRAYLGVAGGSRPLPPRAAALTGQQRGIEVTEVIAGSPAARAGIRPEDILIRIGDITIEDVGALQETLTEDYIGQPVEMTLVRGGEVVSVPVKPMELDG